MQRFQARLKLVRLQKMRLNDNMERYIRNSSQDESIDEFKDLVRIFRFTIDAIYEEADLISASNTKPLTDAEGVYNSTALDDYQSFLLSILDIFDDHNFDVIKESSSPYSQSYYAAFVKRDQIERADYKFILFVRLSDHPSNSKTVKGKQKYYRDLAERLKQPTTKTKQLWKLKEITVNSQTFDSYDAALAEIDKILRQYD